MRQEADNPHSSHSSLSFEAPKTIVLVGLMGCGKTSIGKKLAKRLDISFYDSDAEIEEAAGCSIQEIFDVHGENFLRDGEQRVIARLLDQPIHVLATGGGSYMHAETRRLISEKAISVWLKADLDTLLRRVGKRKNRPLLADENQEEILTKLIDERYPIYAEANVIVDTFDEPASTTVDRLALALTQYIREHYPTKYVLKNVTD